MSPKKKGEKRKRSRDAAEDAVSQLRASFEKQAELAETSRSHKQQRSLTEDQQESFNLLKERASEGGHSSVVIEGIVTLVCEPKFPSKLVPSFLHLLVPDHLLDESLLVELLGAASGFDQDGKLVLLKWMCCVYDYVNHQHGLLHRLYSVLFHYLEYSYLRPFACSILYRLTRLEDVRPFRVRLLHRLLLKDGIGAVSSRPLLALLSLFKKYQPDRIVVPREASTHLRSALSQLYKVPDRQLFANIVRAVTTNDRQSSSPSSSSAMMMGMQSQRIKTGTALSRQTMQLDDTRAVQVGAGELLPAVVTSREKKRRRLESTNRTIALEEIGTFKEFALHADRIGMPDQCASLLRSVFFQHFISLHPNRSVLVRVCEWLKYVLEEEFFWKDLSGQGGLQRREVLLGCLQHMAKFHREVMPGFEDFLYSFLRQWNGQEHCSAVFSLITNIRPCPYETLYTTILRPLLKGICFKAGVINCLSLLLCHWSSMDWASFFSAKHQRQEAATSYIFGEVSRDVDHFQTMYQLIRFVDQIWLHALQTENDHPILLHAILSFYERTANLPIAFRLPFVVPPSFSLFKRMLIRGDGLSVSRGAGIIALYKDAFESVKKSTVRLNFPNGMNRIKDEFNPTILIFCTALWRKLFQGNKGDSFDLPMSVVKENEYRQLPYLYSIIQSKQFVSFAHRFMQGIREQQEARTHRKALIGPEQITAQRKASFLDWLRDIGFEGLHDFMHTYIKSLAQKRQS